MNPATEKSTPPADPKPTVQAPQAWWRQVTLSFSPAQLAMGLFGLACLIGLAVVAWPQAAGFGGLAFLIGITICGSALILAITSGRLIPAESPARLFGTALDTDPRACCITMPDGSVAYANPAWRKLFGRSNSGGEVLPVAGFSSDQETAQRLYALVRSASLKEARDEELKLRNMASKWVSVAVAPISSGGHTVWRVTEAEAGPILAALGEVPLSYVADGHHRSASAARVGKERRERGVGLDHGAICGAQRDGDGCALDEFRDVGLGRALTRGVFDRAPLDHD